MPRGIFCLDGSRECVDALYFLRQSRTPVSTIIEEICGKVGMCHPERSRSFGEAMPSQNQETMPQWARLAGIYKDLPKAFLIQRIYNNTIVDLEIPTLRVAFLTLGSTTQTIRRIVCSAQDDTISRFARRQELTFLHKHRIYSVCSAQDDTMGQPSVIAVNVWVS